MRLKRRLPVAPRFEQTIFHYWESGGWVSTGRDIQIPRTDSQGDADQHLPSIHPPKNVHIASQKNGSLEGQARSIGSSKR